MADISTIKEITVIYHIRPTAPGAVGTTDADEVTSQTPPLGTKVKIEIEDDEQEYVVHTVHASRDDNLATVRLIRR